MASTSTIRDKGFLLNPSLDMAVHYMHAGERYRRALREMKAKVLAAKPVLSLSQWADENAYLSPETSAQHGKFRAFSYQNGIMDAITDPAIERITVMKSARIGYTKILDNAIGYYIHQDPCPILVVQPRVEDAEDYSRTEIAPMLRDTPVLRSITGTVKEKDKDQRIVKRVFNNGASISFVGANSPGGFRRVTARIVAFDEVDGYAVKGAGDEGDQIKLGTKRSETFWNRKIIAGSTPKIKATSRILRLFNQGDQRRYYVPCPHCFEPQVLRWKNLRWDKGDYDSAHFVCSANGCIIEETNKRWMVENGDWIAEGEFKKGHASFHIWTAYSLFPNARWANLAQEWDESKNDVDTLKTFINTTLGEAWEDKQKDVEAENLREMKDSYEAPPAGKVLVVTNGVDVQDGWLACERVGWGVDDESWSIEYKIIYGDLSTPDPWTSLDEWIKEPVHLSDGSRMWASATCIDSGGHYTEAVYQFARFKERRKIWAIKGEDGEGRQVWPRTASKTEKSGQTRFFLVGVDAAKEIIYSHIQKTIADGQPGGENRRGGPGYVHVPEDREDEWFEELCGEVLIQDFKSGVPIREWKKKAGVRNEGLDCRVYAFAALRSLGIHWSRYRAALAAAQEGLQARHTASASSEKPKTSEQRLERMEKLRTPTIPPPAIAATMGRVSRSSFMARR